MNAQVRALFAARESSDRDAAYKAFVDLMTLAQEPVTWSYEVWDQLVGDLSHRDGHKRAFAAQLLARLAISDPEHRMRRDFAALAKAMRDEKTVTARHALQSIWRVGLAGPDRLALVLDALGKRFRACSSEKHASLVRTDVITSLGHLFCATGDPSIEACAERLIASDRDEGARRKQRSSWTAAARPRPAVPGSPAGCPPSGGGRNE
jgi:hypothetical protein